jgi:IS5 family transposase
LFLLFGHLYRHGGTSYPPDAEPNAEPILTGTAGLNVRSLSPYAVTLDPLLQQISDFIEQHQTLVEHVRQDLQRGLTNPATGRNGLDARQVLRSLTLMRVKNWDHHELRERIAGGYTLRQFTQVFSHPVPKHDAFYRAFAKLTPATLN